jgi:hypothetical protein
MSYAIFPPVGESNWREIEDALMERKAAQIERNWKRADEIRDKLIAEGIILRDVPNGVHWIRAHVQERAGMNEEWNARFAPLYKRFVPDRDNSMYDWSDDALLAAYRYETRGEGDLATTIFSGGKINGYAHGKKLMDITISGWREMIEEGLFCKAELYDEMPDMKEWLDRVLSGVALSKDGVELRSRMIKYVKHHDIRNDPVDSTGQSQ